MPGALLPPGYEGENPHRDALQRSEDASLSSAGGNEISAVKVNKKARPPFPAGGHPYRACLLNLNLLYGRLLLSDLDFRYVNGKDTIVDRGLDFVPVHILRKSNALFELAV